MADLPDVLLDILISLEEGRTWKQLQKELRTKNIHAHHGTISGALSQLHKNEDVFYLIHKVDNCHPYIHTRYKSKYPISQRVDKPRTTKWRKVADTLYEAMTNIDTTNEEWEQALSLYKEALDD